jgi:small GTP-binding protein
MKNAIKIIISGLDNAGKTSILTALDKKYNFQQEVMELKPTIRVEYHQTEFLGNLCFFWDMGGQEIYRKHYQKHQDVYFDGTDLLVYVIDIQDKERFETSLSYLDVILQFFMSNDMDIPIIVSFHKYDPELRGLEEINDSIDDLREIITEKYPEFKILFQQTSIYDIISIIHLISYGLSIFDEKFFELSLLVEDYLVNKFDSTSLILFDQNGIIISEFYREFIEPEIYIELLESIKEHLFLLKRMQEEDFSLDYNFFDLENKLVSYLHKITIRNDSYYVSVVIEENNKENLLDKFPDLVEDITKILESILP